MRQRLWLLPVLLLCAAGAAELPAPQTKPKWTARHEEKLQEIRASSPSVIFVGDSITEELENSNPRFGDINGVWRRFYACHNAVNLGFAGDTTGNVLWRLQNGEVSGIHPKLAVVLIGTNDIGARDRASPADAAAGIREVVATLHRALPATHILLLGLLPRERDEASRVQVNAALATMSWAPLNASYADVSRVLLSGGTAAPALYREAPLGRPLLHPNAAGWTKIAEAISPQVAASVGGTCPG